MVIYLCLKHHIAQENTDMSKNNISSGVPRNFVRGRGGQQIHLRTEDRENGDLGAVAP